MTTYKLYACEHCGKLFVQVTCPGIKPDPVGGTFNGDIGFYWAICEPCKKAPDLEESRRDGGVWLAVEA